MGGKDEGKQIGLDVIDEQLKASARGLLASVKQAKRVDAFAAWQEHASLETSISLLEREVKPYEAILNSLPQDRNKEDVRKICGLLRQMSAYKAFAPHILEFISMHCQLMVVWEGVELPRTGEEASHLYNVVCGHMQCLVADPRDPLIHYAVHNSAQQILKKEEEAAAAEAKASPRSPKFPPKKRSLFTMESPRQQSPKAADSRLPTEFSPHESSPYISNSDTVYAYNLPPKCQRPSVACKLWQEVLDRIRAGRLPPRAEAEESLASMTTRENRIRERRRLKRRSSQAGRNERQDSVRRRSSGAGESFTSREGGRRLPSPDTGEQNAAEQAQGPGSIGGPNNPWPMISVLQLCKGESFSGRELDCFHEIGLMEGGAALEIPTRAVAALPVPNSMAALLYVSRAIYRRALDMVQEHTIGQAVSRCCRLPFLRHTPLKELYKLARHLHEVHLSKGDTLIEQGKESSNLYFLIEGEVEVVVDVPYSGDRELLESALQSKMQVQDNGGTEGRSSVAASVWSSRSTTKAAPYSGPLQRVVMARRGPGSILGDDSLRERKTAVGVVVSSSSILALAVSQQRFAMSVDALTLRLFMRLKQQQGALPLMSQAVSAALLSKQKVDQCRKVILSQALSPNIRSKMENETSHASEAEMMQLLLSSPGSKASHKQKPSMGWNRTSSHAHDPPAMLSLASGDRADNLAALHKKNQDAYQLEMRQQALADREDQAKSAATSAPSSPGGKQKNQPNTEMVHDSSNTGTGGVLAPETAAALKSLNRSKRVMPAGIFGADPGAGLPSGSGRLSVSQIAHGTEGKEGDSAGQGLGDLMAHSMQTAWMDKIHVTESVAQLRQMIKQAADKRRAEVLDQEHRNLQGRSNLVNVDARIVHKLDISVHEASGSTLKHTTMLESACIAIIKVNLLPGQAVAPCDDLAPMLDDAVVGWSASAHSAHLQLIRWSSFDYALVARIDPSESKRGGVKAAADCLLEMKRHFDHTVATNAVPHYTFCTGLACGGAFAQHNGGHFLTGLSGTAVKAAQQLSDAAAALQGPHSCILISDVAMQAINHTHVLCFRGAAYELLDWIQLPCNSSFNDIFGPGNFEAEPVSLGTIPTDFQAGTEEDELAVPISREQSRLSTSSGWAWNSFRQPKPKSHLQCAAVMPELGAQERQPASPVQRCGKRGLRRPQSQDPERSSAPVCLWVDIPDKASDPGTGLPRVASPSYLPLPSPAFPSPQGGKSLSRSSSSRSKPRRGPSRLTTLEPELRHSRVLERRNRAELTSSMDVRQRLRQDLQASRSQQAQQPGGACMSPSLGSFFGGLQEGLKTWGNNGRARKTPIPTFQGTNQPWNLQSPTPSNEQQQQQQQQQASLSLYHHQEQQHKQQQEQQQEQQHKQASLSLQHHQLAQLQQGRPRTSSLRSPLSTKPDVFPHYAPGSKSPLASLSARQRASEVLFTGAALASSAHQLIRPVSPSRSSAPPLTHSPTSSPRSSSPPYQTLGETTMAQDSMSAALQDVVRQKRASPERLLPQRPDSALQALHRPLSAQHKAFAAAVALDGRPKSAGCGVGEHGPLRLASPSLRLHQAMPSSPPATPPGQKEPHSSREKLLPSNHGYMPASMLQYPRCARPQPGGGGLGEQDTQGTRSWYPPPDTPLHPSSAPVHQGSMAAPSHGSPCGNNGQFGEPGSLQESPTVPAQVPMSAQSAVRTSTATTAVKPGSRGSSVRPRSRMHTPSFMHSRHVDPYTSMSLAAIHEQAISTWKDLGSLNAAQEYVEQLPQGQVNVSFSAAGLTALPDLSRLVFLESLAASFNSFHLCPDPQAILGSKPLLHLSVLCMSHCGLTELPCNVGRLLPALTELNLAHNSITDLPLSLFQCTKLRAMSLEHNHLCALSGESLSRLSGLEALYLGSNSLQDLPDCLPSLPLLGVLDVTRNKIKELPASLPACTQLVVLSVAHNRLTALPPSFLDALSNLRWLELQGNSLRSCPEVNGGQVASAVMAQDAANALAAKAYTAAAEARASSVPELACLQDQASEEGVLGHGRVGGQQGQLLQRRRTKGRLLSPTGDAGLEDSCEAALQQGAGNEELSSASQQEAESEQSDEAAAVVKAPESAAIDQDMEGVQEQQAEALQEQQQEQAQQQQQEQQDSQARPSSPPKICKSTSFSARLQQERQEQPQQQEQQASQVRPSSTPKTQRTASFSAKLHAKAWQAPTASILENELMQEMLAKSTPCRLPNLRWLNLANNRLALPPFWLPSSLTGLDLSRNRLTIVPAWLLDGLPQLQMLAMHGNCITEVCEEVMNLKSLKMVSLEENPATDPGNLTEGGGSWVSEYVCTAKYDHKLLLEAELQARGKHRESQPSRLSS